jgi:hypothetical protein
MFGLDWWILVLLTVVCNLIWPPVTLAITLWWGIRSTNKTLSRADAIEKKVTAAIATLDEERKTENVLAEILEEQEKGLKQMLDGFRGDIIKKVEGEIKDAKAEISTGAGIKAGDKPSIQDLLMAGAMGMMQG